MIFAPPRHGKSEITSRRFPAWYLGRNPDKQIIAASYNSDLATDFGRDVRNIVALPEYRALFPQVALRADSQAAERWHTEQGGMYVAAGVGTAVTGRGAHVLLIDDPFKDRAEADSEVRRKHVWEWYTNVAYTRLMPGGAVVLINTRWHEDDLSGRLQAQAQAGGDQWDVVDLPALDDQGHALWPEWYPVDRLKEIRAVLGPRDWSALYQQRPTPEEGAYFKRDWFRWYDTAPDRATLKIYGASDYAVTEDGGDWTCHLVFGVDPNDDIYVLDCWRGQTASDVWIETLMSLTAQWRPSLWAEENGQIAKSIGPYIVKRQRELKNYFVREQFASAHDKPTRARSIQARMAMGKVYFPKQRDFVIQLIEELLRFPAGTHDDQVDALSLGGRMLDLMGRGKPLPPPPDTVMKGKEHLPFRDLLKPNRDKDTRI